MSPTGTNRFLCRMAAPLLAAAFLLQCLPAQADRTTDQVELAASGRFDTLESQLEAQAAKSKLDTRDLHMLCYAYSKTKRYTKLMACLDALAISLRTGSPRSRLFQLDDATPSMVIMRAEALVELGQYADAVKEAQRNLKWLEKEQSDDLDMLYNSHAVLSIAYTLSGDRERGLQAANLLAATSSNPLGAYNGARAMAMARTRMALGDFPGVIAALNTDKLFATNIFLDRLVSGSFFTGTNNWVWVELPRAYMMNKALLETGQATQAKAGFDRLISIPQTRENGEIYWQLLHDRGRIAEAEKDLPAANALYRQAVDIVEQQRGTINTEASKIGFVGDKQALYAAAINAALATGDRTLAFEYMERAKSRALNDLLATKSADAALQPKNADAQADLASFRQAASDAAAQLPVNMASATQNDSRGLAQRKSRELKARDPELASLLSVDTLPVADIRKLLQKDDVLVEYFIFGKQLLSIAITPNDVVSSSQDAATLEAEVLLFRSQIDKNDKQAMVLAKSLYEKLFGPFAQLVAGKNIVVVPHGVLHYLPYAALHDQKDYLIATHNLRYLPSATVQKFLRRQDSRKLENILILGNPDLGKKELALPSAEREAQMIAQLVPQSKVLVRKDASETAVKTLAGNYPYLHFATHGQFNTEAPLLSRLVLAADADNDGSLTVSKVFGLRLNAELVTLSACETGLSKGMNGDDRIGMTRAFLYAGSSNIIASHWEVDDAATTVLMKQFYLNLLAGQSKQEALRRAQQSMWAKYPDPVYWAAFYLTGHGA